jgi:hypothetical protein
MKRLAAVAVASLVAVAVVFFTASGPVGQRASLGISAAKAGTGDAKVLNPCAPPGAVSANISQTAWQLWVAATCPVNAAQYPFVVWQNWIEQAQEYPKDPSLGLEVPNAKAATTTDLHVLHGSPLTLIKNPALASVIPGLLGGADQNCNKAATPPAGRPAEWRDIRLYRGDKPLEPARPGQRRNKTSQYPIRRFLCRNQIRLDFACEHRTRLQQSSVRFHPENSRRNHPWQLLWTRRHASDLETFEPVDMGDL